jgi:hypothetical protein
MAKVTILNQRHPSGKILNRGVFTQKKKLWETMTGLAELTSLVLLDDVSGKEIQASYNGLCEKLRRAGRAVLVEPGNPTGVKAFLVTETVTNELRDWDLDEQGNPRYNPAKGGDEEASA